MSDKLTGEDISMILKSLRYTNIKFETYDQYPSEEFSTKRLEDVNKVMEKVRRMRSNQQSLLLI